MRHLRKRLLMAAVTAVFVLLPAIPAMAFSSNTVVFQTVDNPSAGCVLVALDGEYAADAQAALNRINEIRYEACREGVENPSNPGTPLTEADYVPIKWSSSLEYIARVRAAESSLVISHTRPNGNSCFSVTAPDGAESFGEVIAWNGSKSMISGINQWYGEKSAWVNKTGGDTGHYTQMINPNNLYVGIGCFLYSNGVYYNTTAGEFSFRTDEGGAPMSAIPDCRVIIEIKQEALRNTKILETDIKRQEEGALDKGDIIRCSLGIVTELEGDEALVLDAGNIQWTSSDSSVATVNTNGDVQIKDVGTVVITASSDSGKSASVTLKPAHTVVKDKAVDATFASTGLTEGTHCSVCHKVLMKQKTVPKLTALPTSVKAKVKKNKVTVSWKKIADKKLLKKIKSVQVQYSKKKNFKKAVTKTVRKDKTKSVLKLKKKKTYYIRVRYKGTKGFSKWSPVKKVKTRK